MMKRPEEMTDAELDAFLLSGAAPKQKSPEEMTDAELDAYLLSGKQAKPSQEKISVSNEAADIGWVDRLAVKNFGGSTQDQVDFLKKRYSGDGNPKLEIKEYQGEIIAKKPEETSWKKLDPSGAQTTKYGSIDVGKTAKEALLDLGDVGYDVASGIGSSIAGAAGAVPGALFGAGAGGLATGAAASGAASAGLETIRQAIGKALGTRKELSGKEIAISGTLGAATTGLLGAGASKKLIEKAAQKPEVVKKSLEKIMEVVPKELTEETKIQLTKEIIEEGQKGALQNFGKSFLSKWSGIPKDELVRATTEVPSKTLINLAERGVVKPDKKYTNLELADVLEKSGLNDFGQLAKENIFPVLQRAKNETSSALKTAFGASDDVVSMQSFGEPIRRLKQFYETKSVETGTDAYKNQIAELDRALSFFGKEGEDKLVSPSSIFDLKNQISEMIDWTKTPGASLKDGAVSITYENALKDSERLMAGYLDKVLENQGQSGLRQQYKEHLDFQRYLLPKFKDEDTAIKTLSNVETLRNPTLKRVIENFERKYPDADIKTLSDVASTWKYFGRPAAEPVGGGGSVKVMRGGTVGGAAGYLAGNLAEMLTGIPKAAEIGGAIGLGLGSLSSSPQAIKSALQAETALGRGLAGATNQFRAQQLQDLIQRAGEKLPAAPYTQSAINKQAAAQSAWQLMGGQ